jgi:hypothetical protein
VQRVLSGFTNQDRIVVPDHNKTGGLKISANGNLLLIEVFVRRFFCFIEFLRAAKRSKRKAAEKE